MIIFTGASAKALREVRFGRTSRRVESSVMGGCDAFNRSDRFKVCNQLLAHGAEWAHRTRLSHNKSHSIVQIKGLVTRLFLGH